MKKGIVFVMLAILLFGAAACAATDTTSKKETAQGSVVSEAQPAQDSLASETAPADEYQRAVWYGFVAQGTSGKPEMNVTERDMADMLSAMIARYDANLVGDWGSFTANAGSTELTKDYAALFILYAAEMMGIDRFNAGFAPYAHTDTDWDAIWKSMNSPFSIFEDKYREVCESISAERGNTWEIDYAGAGVQYAISRISNVSGRPLMEFDDGGHLDCSRIITVEEAALAVVRLYESTSTFVKLTSIDNAEACKAVLPEDTLALAASMPDAAWNRLPSWQGVTLTNMMEAQTLSAQQPWTFSRQDIEDIASFGFNFIRIPIDSHLIFDGENQAQVNMNHLKSLDALIGWCAQYGIHVCVDLHNCIGFSTDGDNSNDTMWESQSEQALFIQFWSLLAQRYKDVPSSLLSFNLINEPTDVSDERYVEVMRQAIDAIRVYSPQRLIFVDMYQYATQPIYSLVDAEVAQSFHCYEPHSFTHDFMHEGVGTWPSVTCKGSIMKSQGAFTIEGIFPAGNTIEFSLGSIHLGGTLRLRADGTDILTYEFGRSAVGKDGCTEIGEEGTDGEWRSYEDLKFTAQLPADAHKLTLTIDGESQWFELRYLSVDTGEMQLQINTDIDYSLMPEGKDFNDIPNPHIVIAEDGAISDVEDVFFRVADKSYLEAYLQKYDDFTRETGVAVMMQEFGVHYSTVYQQSLTYLNDLLSAADKVSVGWCAWDYQGSFNFVALDAGTMREGATYTDLHGNGWVAEEMLEVLQRYIS